MSVGEDHTRTSRPAHGAAPYWDRVVVDGRVGGEKDWENRYQREERQERRRGEGRDTGDGLLDAPIDRLYSDCCRVGGGGGR